MRDILKGSTDQSTVIRIVDSTDGTPETGVVFNTSGIDLWYRREGATKASITEATLSALDDAHSDGGILHIADGYYRLDLPDAAVATGANGVAVGGTVTGMVVIGAYHPLVDFNPYDGVRLGLTSLPNAAAEASGGLFTRGSGAGQIAQDANGRVSTNLVAISGSAVDNTSPQLGVNLCAIHGDSGASQNAEKYFDGTGFGEILVRTVISSLSSQTSFVLSAGATQDDAYNNRLIIIEDNGDSTSKCVASISDYTGSSKTVTLAADPGIFTMAAGDIVTILAVRSGTELASIASLATAAELAKVPKSDSNVTWNATALASINAEADTALSDYGALKPTTAGRTLDVTATGAAGVDWSNIENPTTTVDLSGTTISTSQAVASVSGAVGSVTGAVGSVTGNVGGNVAGSVGSVTGNVGGNVTGSIGSLATQAKADVNAEADAALVDINLDHLVKSAVDTNFATTVHLDSVIGQLADNGTTATFDRTTDSQEAIRDRGDSAWTTATGFSTLDAAGVRTAVGLASANLDTQFSNLDGKVSIIQAVAEQLDDTLVDQGGGVYGFTTAALQAGDDATLAAIAALNDLSAADVWSAATRTLTALDEDSTTLDLDATIRGAVGMASANLDTQIDALPTAAENASATAAAVTSDHGSGSYVRNTEPLDAAGTRTAIGLASANLDTQLSTIDTVVDSILADTGTDGVVLSTTTLQSIADTLLARNVSNVEGSAPEHSLTTLVLAMLESSRSGTTWTIKRTDGSTTHATKTLTVDAAADPITGVT